jgi:hypothetical protein
MSTLENEPAFAAAETLTEKSSERNILVQETSQALTTLQEAWNRALRIQHPKVQHIAFGTTADETMTARYDAGTLTLGAHEARTQALEQLSALDPLLSDAADGQAFIFRNGSWAAAGNPVSLLG